MNFEIYKTSDSNPTEMTTLSGFLWSASPEKRQCNKFEKEPCYLCLCLCRLIGFLVFRCPALYIPLWGDSLSHRVTQLVSFETWDHSDIWSETKKTKRQKRPKYNKTKRQKDHYCGVWAGKGKAAYLRVSHVICLKEPAI